MQGTQNNQSNLEKEQNQKTRAFLPQKLLQPARMRGGRFEGEGIHIYVWLSPFTVHPKLPQHC